MSNVSSEKKNLDLSLSSLLIEAKNHVITLEERREALRNHIIAEMSLGDDEDMAAFSKAILDGDQETLDKLNREVQERRLKAEKFFKERYGSLQQEIKNDDEILFQDENGNLYKFNKNLDIPEDSGCIIKPGIIKNTKFKNKFSYLLNRCLKYLGVKK